MPKAYVSTSIALKPLNRAFWPSLVIFVLSSFLIMPSSYAQESTPLVGAIEIKGNKKIDETTIRVVIKTKLGDPFSVVGLRKDLVSIFKLGYFSDVRIETEELEGGLRVIFVVFEKPTVKELRITGNKKVETKDIQEKLKIKAGDFFSSQTLKESADAVRVLYEQRGYLYAKIEPKLKEAEGAVTIELAIDEGKKLSVTEIDFEGNKSISSRKLRRAIIIKRKGWFSYFTGSGAFVREALNVDRLRIQYAYENEGFVRVQAGDPKVDINKEAGKIKIVFTVIEGPRFKVGDVNIKGDQIYSAVEIKKTMSQKSGEFFSREELRNDILKIIELYGQKGYAFAEVAPTTNTDDEKKVVNIAFEIDPGLKTYVGRINVTGNFRTRDYVLRREFRFHEGDLYDSAKYNRSVRRIKNLNIFEDVSASTKRGARQDLVDIDVKTTEKPTGAISGGVGFSSVENFIFGIGIRQDNFRGTGERLALRGAISSIRSDVTFSFFEPYLLDHKVSLLLDLFKRRDEFPIFTEDTLGGDVVFGKELTEVTKLYFGYRFEDSDIIDISRTAPSFIRRQAGKVTISAIQPSIVRDTTDSRIAPTKGAYSRLFFEFAGGPLGGTDFIKSVGEIRWYRTLATLSRDKQPLILYLRGLAGYVNPFGDELLPVFERFFLGGPETLRGFRFREAGPRDATGEEIGGTSELIFTGELIVPLPRVKLIKTLIFTDIGNAYDENHLFDLSDLRYNVGLGFRFITPIGVAGLDVGFKLDKRDNESASAFHFRIGRAF